MGDRGILPGSAVPCKLHGPLAMELPPLLGILIRASGDNDECCGGCCCCCRATLTVLNGEDCEGDFEAPETDTGGEADDLLPGLEG